jgi:hypothetical protein
VIPETKPESEAGDIATEAVQRSPSGRAVRHRKVQVERTHRLDLAELRRDGVLDPGLRVWHSRAFLGGLEASELLYGLAVEPSGRRRLLLGHLEGRGSAAKPVTYAVALTATPCRFGGERWWFQCPLVLAGVPCRRRCRILYRPRGARFFGCRRCHNLTYRSRQFHRQLFYEGPWRGFDLVEDVRRRPRLRAMRKVRLRAGAPGARGRGDGAMACPDDSAGRAGGATRGTSTMRAPDSRPPLIAVEPVRLPPQEPELLTVPAAARRAGVGVR